MPVKCEMGSDLQASQVLIYLAKVMPSAILLDTNMFTSTILPDFRKLRNYHTITDEQISAIEGSGGVNVELDYMNEEDYLRVAEGLKIITQKYVLESHYTEILYLTLKKNEQIRERYDAYWQNYEDDLTSKEVAKFLLAYKISNTRQDFHLTAKPLTGSVTIKDSAIARWMADLIYTKIEQREFPLGLFGEKILFDLFGDEWDTKEPIKLERLEATANLSPRKPTVRIKKLYVEFCLYLQVYLINHTDLTLPGNGKLTDAQANFFFDLLALLRYVDSEKIASEPKDYMHAMFGNYIS
jgi:hypothetical protein